MYREACIDYLRNQRAQLEQFLASMRYPTPKLPSPSSVAPQCRSPQLATLILLDHFRRHESLAFEVVEMLSQWQAVGARRSEPAPSVFHPTRPVMQAVQGWVAGNPALIGIWARSDLKALHDAPPAVWEKIVRRGWVSKAELSR